MDLCHLEVGFMASLQEGEEARESNAILNYLDLFRL